MSNVSNIVVTLSNGVTMPQLGISVGQLAGGEGSENAVGWALEAGYRHIDTAAIYKNEESVGAGIRASGVPREEIFVTTKLWNTDQGYESTLEAFETSRKKLGLDYIDLYLINWPKSLATNEREGKKYWDTWRAFEKLYEEKKVRAIGVCNFKIHHLDDILEMCTVPPMVDQVELHPLNSEPELRRYCDSKKICVAAWSPLGLGKLVGNPVIMSVAEKYHKTLNQVILRWDIQRNIVTIPMSMTNRERIASNADVFDFELTAEELAQIDALNTNTRNCADPDESDC